MTRYFALGLGFFLISSSVQTELMFKGSQEELVTQNNQKLSDETLTEIAKSITVKISNSSSNGSGFLIKNQGNKYIVVTNAHVISADESYQVKTLDGNIYESQLIWQGDSFHKNDLALLEFNSLKKYAIASSNSAFSVKENQSVLTAGYASNSQELTISKGEIAQILEQPLLGGYQIGYTNQTKGGMSGGPVLAENGTVIAVHGMGTALLNSAYIYQDGSPISTEQINNLRQLAFAIPIDRILSLEIN